MKPVFRHVFRDSQFNGVFDFDLYRAVGNMFSNPTVGVWYDPTDLSSMFQDSAGTIPVTAPGQPVGLRRDKSGRGNNAIQATAGARLTYGIEPKTGTRNQMLPSQPPVSGGGIWNPPTNSTVVASGEQVTITVTTTGIEAGYRTVPVFAINTQYTVSADFKPGTARYALLRNIGSNHNAWFDLQTAMVGTVSAGATATISLVSDGFYRCTITSTTGGTIVANLLDFRPASGDGLFSATGGQTISLRRAQLEIGPAATAYQKVVTAFEVTEAGVPTCHYCAYAGANSMATASIDFTATDKMSIFAGLRKSSDAGSYSMVAELSVASFSNNGAFAFMAPYTGATYGFESRGTAIAAAVSPATFAAPVNSLLTALGDISGDRATLRINGLQVAQSTSDQGTGNYGNYPLYFGRRAGSTLPFNGRDYGIIIAGKSASLQEISNAERLLANNTPSVTL